jgi:phosphohistidine phosphatase
VAAWLEPLLPDDTRILCSPALRCEQTVRRWAQVQAARGPAAGRDPGALLDAAQWPVPSSRC